MSGASVLFDAPGPRARLRNHLATAVTVVVVGLVAWFVLAKLSDSGQLEASKWTPFLEPNTWTTFLIPGIQNTLKAAAISIVLALALGVLLGIGRMSPSRLISTPCAIFVEFFRAVPVLIMMYFSYEFYADFKFFDSEYWTLAGVVTGLTLYNGAVVAEIVRAGVNALPRGQSEAAWSLGLRWGQTMRSVLLPQAVTSMLPVLVSQLVVVLKDTALGVAITYPELVAQVSLIVAGGNTSYIPALTVVALLMIVVNFALSSFAVWLEGRLRRSTRMPAPLDPEKIELEGGPGAKVAVAPAADEDKP